MRTQLGKKVLKCDSPASSLTYRHGADDDCRHSIPHHQAPGDLVSFFQHLIQPDLFEDVEAHDGHPDEGGEEAVVVNAT